MESGGCYRVEACSVRAWRWLHSAGIVDTRGRDSEFWCLLTRAKVHRMQNGMEENPSEPVKIKRQRERKDQVVSLVFLMGISCFCCV